MPPGHVYKGVQEGGRVGPYGAPWRSPTPTGRIPPLPSSRSKRQGRGRRKRRKEGAQPLPLVQFGLGLGGARPASPSPLKPNKAHILLLPYSRNSLVLRKIHEPRGTFPMSEYSRPIYRSLCLDHYETTRHVPDLIGDSELPLVHQNT